MSDLAGAQREFTELREQASSAMLATISEENRPAASHAPLVWMDGDCYLFLSELAAHARNLKQRPVISLMLAGKEGANAFARKRITLEGSVVVVARDDPLFERVLVEFHRRFGKVMELLEPLPDFSLFRVCASEGRFVRGFGQAYDLTGKNLDQLVAVKSAK